MWICKNSCGHGNGKTSEDIRPSSTGDNVYPKVGERLFSAQKRKTKDVSLNETCDQDLTLDRYKMNDLHGVHRKYIKNPPLLQTTISPKPHTLMVHDYAQQTSPLQISKRISEKEAHLDTSNISTHTDSSADHNPVASLTSKAFPSTSILCITTLI